MKNNVSIIPARSLKGTIEVTGDRDISYISMILCSLAKGNATISNCLLSVECVNTIKILKKLGVKIRKKQDKTLLFYGKGRYGLKKTARKLNFGNSETGLKMLAGVLSSQLFPTVFYGDPQVSSIPLNEIMTPLMRMGAKIHAKDGGFLPLDIKPGVINGITYHSPISCFHMKSCVLLAGLYTDDKTIVEEPAGSRDHTERMMEYFGINIENYNARNVLSGGRDWNAKNIIVPGDFSEAAYYITGCLLIPDSEVCIKRVGLNPTRTGFLDIIRNMGADISIDNEKRHNNEESGDLMVKYNGVLKPVEVDEANILSILDEIPLVCLLASQAPGTTVIDGLSLLRKTDLHRLHLALTQLQNMGLSIGEQRNSIIINGGNNPLKGAYVDSFKDYRTAMLITIAALAAGKQTILNNSDCIKAYRPEFQRTLDDITKR